MFDKNIQQVKTITAMVESYQEQIAKIESAYHDLHDAQEEMRVTFDQYARVTSDYRDPLDMLKKAKIELHKRAWKSFVDRSEIRKVLSVKESDKLDKQLDTGEDLPEITVANVMDTLKYLIGRGDEFAKEAIVEVFDMLRPCPRWSKPYKTNKQFKIGKKVILTRKVRPWHHSGHAFQVIYNSESDLRAIDRVFHMLDGKGTPNGYVSPLIDAINTSEDGSGETDYFVFKCHKNGNLHLQFKRIDLVNEINRIGSDGTLGKDVDK